jgi:hypothetical protein
MDVRYSVVALLLLRRPPAIAGLVVAIVVWPAIQGRAARSLAHIREKVLEIAPAVANCDATPFVVGECGIGWLSASGDHALPRTIGRRPFSVGAIARVLVAALGAATRNDPTRA